MTLAWRFPVIGAGVLRADAPPPPPPPPPPLPPSYTPEPPSAPPPGFVPPPPPGQGSSDQAPNGTLILCLGIAGILGHACGFLGLFTCCCGLFALPLVIAGFVAFFMGRGVLRQYPNCQQTKAGVIMGLITMILTALGIIGTIVSLILGASFGALSNMMSQFSP